MRKGMAQKRFNDPIDAISSLGRLIFNIFTSLVEFQCDLIRKRTCMLPGTRDGYGDAPRDSRARPNGEPSPPKRCSARAN